MTIPNYSGYTTIEVETQSEIALDFKNTLLKKPIIVNSSVELQQLNVETTGNNSITLTSNYKNLNLTIKSSILKNTGSSGTRVIKTLGLNRRNRQTLWGGCTDANPKLLLNDT